MGWLYTHREKGISNVEWFTEELMSGGKHSIIEAATIGRTFYAAVRDNEDGKVFALVALINYAPKDYHNFGYKDMSEDMGPNEAQAPAKVLDALSPTDSEYANEWRARCRENIAQRERSKQVSVGDRLRFTGGWPEGVFEFVGKVGRHREVFRDDDGTLTRISGWRKLAFELEVSA